MTNNKVRKVLFFILGIIAVIYFIFLIKNDWVLSSQSFIFIAVIILFRALIDIIAPKKNSR